MKRGILLVANFKSQRLCENLVYSIRSSECKLPIKLVHFGGKEVQSIYLQSQVEFLRFEDFGIEARQFINDLKSVLTGCPEGFLYRYLAWFVDWNEFIYSDNDIVALCNWEHLFKYLGDADLVHADEEYLTKGKFNYERPEKVLELFGEEALLSAVTAGHVVVKKKNTMIDDFYRAINWFKNNPSVPKKHDQALLHIALLLAQWKTINLCREPYHFLSSWAGDYKNSLQLIQALQQKNVHITHLHFSGGQPKGDRPVQELLLSASENKERLRRLAVAMFRYFSGYNKIEYYVKRARQLL